MNKENGLLSLFQNKNLFSDVLEVVNASMKDTDAIEEKMRMRQILLQVSETITFLVIGNRGVGKTSFLDCMLEQQLLEGEELYPTEGIQEIRYGVERVTVEIEKGHYREFRNNNLLQGIKVYDVQGIDTIAEQEEREKIKHFANESDVVFAMFDVGQIRSYKVWDFIEDVITSFAAHNIAPIEVFRKRFHRKKVIRLVTPFVLIFVLGVLVQFLPVIIEGNVSGQSTESESVESSGDAVDILGDFVDERIENATSSLEGIFDSAMLALLMIFVIVFIVGYGTYAILTLKHLNKRCDVEVAEYLNTELHAFLSGNYIEYQIKYKHETLYEQYEQDFVDLLGELCNGEEIIEKAAMEVEQNKIMTLRDEWKSMKLELGV